MLYIYNKVWHIHDPNNNNKNRESTLQRHNDPSEIQERVRKYIYTRVHGLETLSRYTTVVYVINIRLP